MRKSAPLFCALLLSLSARRAWIEILYPQYRHLPQHVALRKESVDRNLYYQDNKNLGGWSLSARRAWIEIQDKFSVQPAEKVALRKESVDRNTLSPVSAPSATPSLSARRAWIEMSRPALSRLPMASLSARRAWIEIHRGAILRLWACPSLSARRAWIEMPLIVGFPGVIGVALRKESVDRNVQAGLYLLSVMCRSPQGERG